MNALREPLPITFRITSFGGYVSVQTTILNPIEQQLEKDSMIYSLKIYNLLFRETEELKKLVKTEYIGKLLEEKSESDKPKVICLPW